MIKQGGSQNKNFAFIGIPNEKDTALINAVTESNHQIKITFLQDASQTIKNNLIDCVIVSSQYVINNDFLSKQIIKNNELSNKPLVYFNDSIDECIREINTVLNKSELMILDAAPEVEADLSDLNEDLLKGKAF